MRVGYPAVMADVPATAARAITSAVTGLWAASFGKGPDIARTYVNDDNIVVVMHGGLFPHEEALIAAGERETVRTLRHRFERTLAPELCRAVADATGYPVASFDSHMLFGPTRTFELFILDAG